jgi:hypothetical protein
MQNQQGLYFFCIRCKNDKVPHFRKRHIDESFNNLIRHARIVGILGHRQVGKTTFIQAKSHDYITLDEKKSLLLARNDPAEFLEQLSGRRSAIDECQLAPELFPALKIRVGTHQTPGQFILSGSVRFTSREAIRESLTGRISNLEVYPLTLSELDQGANSDFFLRALSAPSLKQVLGSIHEVASIHRQRNQMIKKYLDHGGLPGICFIRELQTRKNLMTDLIETVLDRDIRLVYPTTLPYQTLTELCSVIAQNPHENVSHADIRRVTGISAITQKKLLRALESVFLLRRIPMEGDYKGDIFWFEDQIERFVFTPNEGPTEWDWIGLVYRNCRAQFGYRLGEFPTYSHYLTRGGAQVPLVIQNQGKRLGLFAFASADEITSNRIRSAESLLKKYEFARILFLVFNERTPKLLSERMAIVPMSSALFK